MKPEIIIQLIRKEEWDVTFVSTSVGSLIETGCCKKVCVTRRIGCIGIAIAIDFTRTRLSISTTCGYIIYCFFIDAVKCSIVIHIVDRIGLLFNVELLMLILYLLCYLHEELLCQRIEEDVGVSTHKLLSLFFGLHKDHRD